jgi:hypothetical protein
MSDRNSQPLLTRGLLGIQVHLEQRARRRWQDYRLLDHAAHDILLLTPPRSNTDHQDAEGFIPSNHPSLRFISRRGVSEAECAVLGRLF